MKEKLRKIIGNSSFSSLRRVYRHNLNIIKLYSNFYKDLKAYYHHSHVFKTDNFNKIESELILDYHGLEKGFLHEKLRFRFAEFRIKRMISNLDLINYDFNKSSQVAISLKVLKDYYELHRRNDIDIEDYFPLSVYETIRSKTREKDEICIETTTKSYFSNLESTFPEFSNSRKSIRSFSTKLITEDEIRAVINIARNSPSVCNRQPSKVYFVQNKSIVNKVLSVQGGLSGFDEDIHQILIVTCDRNYFFSVGERNQLYIDGGIFLMNLLYSLHFHKIGACPANWGKEHKQDEEAKEILSLSPSEKIICVIAIGHLKESVKYTLSKRRPIEEILRIVE